MWCFKKTSILFTRQREGPKVSEIKWRYLWTPPTGDIFLLPRQGLSASGLFLLQPYQPYLGFRTQLTSHFHHKSEITNTSTNRNSYESIASSEWEQQNILLTHKRVLFSSYYIDSNLITALKKLDDICVRATPCIFTAHYELRNSVKWL